MGSPHVVVVMEREDRRGKWVNCFSALLPACSLVAIVTGPSSPAEPVSLAEVRQAEDTEAALRAWGADYDALGVYRASGASTFVVRVSAERFDDAIAANASLRWSVEVDVEAGLANRAAVDATREYLIRYAEGNTRSTSAFYYDVRRDVTVLTSDAPATEIKALLTRVPSPVEYRVGRYREQNRSVTVQNALSGRSCTGGVTVVRDGKQRILTAGHCGMLGDPVLVAGRYQGRITERVPDRERDAALIECACDAEQQTFIGRISGRTRFFAAQSDVHTAGATTGERGGRTIDALNATVCVDRCRGGMLAYHGGDTSAEGDSGMPLYLRIGETVLVGGIHTGAIRETGEMFGEAWATIENELFVSLG
jgi:hypothetical protein